MTAVISSPAMDDVPQLDSSADAAGSAASSSACEEPALLLLELGIGEHSLRLQLTELL
jgi:hypothetical protein